MKQTEDVKNLLSFIRNEYGIGLNLSMEKFFSEAEYTNEFHNKLKVGSGRKTEQYKRALDSFYRSVPILFKDSLLGENCTYHETITKKLSDKDTIISFNYDCLIDTALRDHGGNKWDPDKGKDYTGSGQKNKGGYGFQVKSGGLHWRRKETKRGSNPSRSITLLKPHGSLNWRINKSKRNKGVHLMKNPYTITSAERRIIPPTWFKSLDRELYSSIWKRARLQIQDCQALIVIGYSVPPTDFFSHTLFKVDVGFKKKLKFLAVANPDQNARQRFVDLVGGGVGETTRILEFGSFEELSKSL